ncbi:MULTISPECIES: restriction endonuclease subunit S [Clostridium]|uniref:Restriction endonuclease subunit S n=1 Tax=Clostridium lapidicellarium TaxID=3240931 RepID=A0ABV4DYA5_9CLOT|nr:restriction endonuclease subunit S [Clostridiales bacterium]
MDKNKANVPKIRFPGFTDPWEQRKLGEVAEIIGGGTPSTGNPKYWDGDVDWYSPVEIGKQIYVDNSQKKITELGLQKSSAKILPVGTVLFTSRAGIGNTAILAKEGCTNQGFQSIVPHKDELDSYFIFSRTHELKQYGETNGAGSTFMEISGKQMAKMPILIPSMEEQDKIGDFFEKLDNLITLHQRKLNHLKDKKKGLLQKMFPKNGEDFPELRFPGFTDSWEQRKLGDVMNIITDYVAAGSFADIAKNVQYDSNPSYAQLVRTVDIKKKFCNNGFVYIDKKAFEYLWRVNLDEECIILPNIGANIGEVYYLSPVDLPYKNNVLGPNAILLKTTENTKLIYTLFQTEYFQNKLSLIVASSGQPKFNKTELKQIDLVLPNIEEQECIGEFFSNFDNLINLHQRKLNHLKEQKKALLQQMFI